MAAATTLADIAWAEERYRDQATSEEAVRARRTADAWCAAFLTRKEGRTPITHDTLQRIAAGIATYPETSAVDRIATRHRLFHWHLEFPDVFAVPDDGPTGDTGWTGGFTAMLGNPPWETLQMSEKEFFAARAPDIAAAATASARKTAISALRTTDPALHAEFVAESERGESENHLIRMSGRYPLCARGKVNTYSIFAEHFRDSLSPTGRTGIITQTGLATEATTAPFLADTVASKRLAAFYDFENEARIFPGVHNQLRFAVSSMTGGEPIQEVRLAFYTRFVADVPQRRFALAPEEVLALNPNTGTLPVFRTRLDAEITLACYRRHPVLVRDGVGASNPWGLRFSQGLFNMASDSGEFVASEKLAHQGATFDGWAWQQGDHRWLPLYEAKMLSHYNDRFSTYEDATQAQLNKGTLPHISDERLDDPDVEPLARHWVAEATVEEHVPHGWDRGWFLGWRDIARASDARTFVPSVLPRSAVGDKFLLAMPFDPTHAPLLQAVWSSLVFDYIARQKLSGTGMKYFITKQLACPEPATFADQPAWCPTTLDAFVRPRVAELTYTSHRTRPYAVDVLSPLGITPGGPFRWVPERRQQVRAELDAAMLHLYGLDRSDAEHVLDSFFVVEKYERRDHGEFRTKRLVLAAYDAMAEAARTGVLFASPLSPAPGGGPRHT